MVYQVQVWSRYGWRRWLTRNVNLSRLPERAIAVYWASRLEYNGGKVVRIIATD